MSTEQQEQIFTFRVTAQGANAIVAALGQMQTSAGVWPLMQGIIQQVQAQLPQETESQPQAE